MSLTVIATLDAVGLALRVGGRDHNHVAAHIASSSSIIVVVIWPLFSSISKYIELAERVGHRVARIIIYRRDRVANRRACRYMFSSTLRLAVAPGNAGGVLTAGPVVMTALVGHVGDRDRHHDPVGRARRVGRRHHHHVYSHPSSRDPAPPSSELCPCCPLHHQA